MVYQYKVYGQVLPGPAPDYQLRSTYLFMTSFIQITQKGTAVAAAAALVFSTFGLVSLTNAQAQSSTTVVTTTTVAVPFTRDLTIGSTGADVTTLQTWLIAHGYAIPAGPTGYFGMQTRAAVSAYQAAHGIQPTAGYFGPLTRASINAMIATGAVTGNGGTTVPGCQPGFEFSPTTGQSCDSGVTLPPGCQLGFAYSVTTGESCTSNSGGNNDNDNNNDGDLSGGEADLTDFNLLSEDGNGSEGDHEVEAATAEFDVNDGDVEVERAELTLHAMDSDSDEPWDYIDNVSVWADGEMLGDIDTDDRDAWDEEDSDDFSGGSSEQYTVTIDNLDYMVDEGDTAELTFAFDISDSIDDSDLDQEFEIAVLDDGIRAVDSVGIQQYTGDNDEQVTFGFNSEENGDLSINESSDNPDDGVLVIDDNDTSDEMDVLAGEIDNDGDADSLITGMTFSVDTTATGDLSDVVRSATLDIDGETYRGDVDDSDNTIDFDDVDAMVDSDETVEFTLSVEIGPTSSDLDEGDTISFDLDGSDVEAEGADSGDNTDVSGSVNGSQFTFSTTGLGVGTDSSSSSDSDGDTATFTIRFDVSAGDEDVYVPDTAAEDSDADAGDAGAVYSLMHGNSDVTSGMGVSDILTSTADEDGDFFRVDAGNTETFTLSVSVTDAAGTGYFQVELDQIHYNDTDSTSGLTTFNVGDDSDFQAGPEYIN